MALGPVTDADSLTITWACRLRCCEPRRAGYSRVVHSRLVGSGEVLNALGLRAPSTWCIAATRGLVSIVSLLFFAESSSENESGNPPACDTAAALAAPIVALIRSRSSCRSP
jgi:hypothetical protein